MGSRENDDTAPHHPLLSSLVVRPADSGNGGGGGAGSDYEPGEVRRDPPPYSRSDRHDDHGYRIRAGPVSPVRRRDEHHRLSPGFEHSGGAPQSRGLGRGRDSTRRRDYSPPNGRGRFAGRGYHRSARGTGPFKVEDPPRNNPNVRPREGDWICSDPSCKNLNFARREHCNNCNKPRYALSPRRGYPGPASRRFPSPPLDRSPQRIMNGHYRSPPHPMSRDAPRDLRASGPPLRHNGRFPQDHAEDDSRDRYKFDRPMPFDHRDRGRDNYNGRRDYGRRAVSPELPPPRGWAPHSRERSRSPVRGGAPLKDYRRDMYTNRGRGGRRGGLDGRCYG